MEALALAVQGVDLAPDLRVRVTSHQGPPDGHGPLSRTPCGKYSALVLPMRGGVNVFYVSNQKLWGFGLLNFLVNPCR